MSAPGPSAGDDTVPQCARPNFRSRASRSVEPVASAFSDPYEEPSLRDRIAVLRQAAEQMEGRTVQLALDVVTNGQQIHAARVARGPPPPAPIGEPMTVEPPKTPRPPILREARPHTMADSCSVETPMDVDTAANTDLSTATGCLTKQLLPPIASK